MEDNTDSIQGIYSIKCFVLCWCSFPSKSIVKVIVQLDFFQFKMLSTMHHISIFYFGSHNMPKHFHQLHSGIKWESISNFISTNSTFIMYNHACCRTKLTRAYREGDYRELNIPTSSPHRDYTVLHKPASQHQQAEVDTTVSIKTDENWFFMPETNLVMC